MIENLTILWYLAFLVDVILGCLTFYIVISKMVKAKYMAICWYMGWWAFADAIALALNSIMGTDYFWSYHQSGIVTDTAVNIGLVVYISKVIMDNWAMNDEDWAKVEEIRRLAKIRELSK